MMKKNELIIYMLFLMIVSLHQARGIDLQENSIPSIGQITQITAVGRIAFNVTANDLDNDSLALNADGIPSSAKFTDLGNGIGIFDWTPTADDIGITNIIFTVSDGKSSAKKEVNLAVKKKFMIDVMERLTKSANITVVFNGISQINQTNITVDATNISNNMTSNITNNISNNISNITSNISGNITGNITTNATNLTINSTTSNQTNATTNMTGNSSLNNASNSTMPLNNTNQTSIDANSWLELEMGKSTGAYISSEIDYTHAFTISFWFKTSESEGMQVLLSKLDNQNRKIWNIHTNTGNDLLFRIYQNPGSEDYADVGMSNSILPGTWYHVTAIYNVTDVALHVNGQTSRAEVKYPILLSGGDLIVGDAGIEGLGWAGMSDLRIYNRTLNDWEIDLLEDESRFEGSLGQRIPIIYYHDIEDVPTDTYSTSISEFSKEMKYLHDNGFTAITLSDYYDWTKGNYEMPKQPVIIMFDDATITSYENAYPILSNYSFIASVPVITYAPYQPYNYYMNWEQLLELSQHGWEILSHSVDHPDFSLLSAQQITYQFNQSMQDIIDNLDIVPLGFIYPFNRHDSAADALCGEFYSFCTGGHGKIFNPKYSYKSSDPTGGILRISMDVDTSMEDFMPALDEHYNLRSWYLLNDGGTIIKDSGKDDKDGLIIGTGYAWKS